MFKIFKSAKLRSAIKRTEAGTSRGAMLLNFLSPAHATKSIFGKLFKKKK